jgi:translation initiation factor IF-1
MAKEETFEVKGVVLDARPNEQFLVRVNMNGKEADILATLSGNIRKFRIRITEGDKVTVCMSHYDLRRGRITYRDKEEKVVKDPVVTTSENI